MKADEWQNEKERLSMQIGHVARAFICADQSIDYDFELFFEDVTALSDEVDRLYEMAKNLFDSIGKSGETNDES